MKKIICGYGEMSGYTSSSSSWWTWECERAKSCYFLFLGGILSCTLTCESRVRLDGGELEGHLVLASVDDQMLLRGEALQAQR